MNDLLTPAEVSAIFGVSPKTISRWGDNNTLECEKTAGGHRRFRRDAVLAAFEQSQIPKKPE